MCLRVVKGVCERGCVGDVMRRRRKCDRGVLGTICKCFDQIRLNGNIRSVRIILDNMFR